VESREKLLEIRSVPQAHLHTFPTASPHARNQTTLSTTAPVANICRRSPQHWTWRGILPASAAAAAASVKQTIIAALTRTHLQLHTHDVRRNQSRLAAQCKHSRLAQQAIACAEEGRTRADEPTQITATPRARTRAHQCHEYA
jgi:hypothetical protein